MNNRKLTVTILAFILFSIHMFGQNTISYTYDSAGNRTGRSASENTIALHAISPQNGPTADNLKIISVRARNNEVPTLNNTLAVNISTIGHTDWKFALLQKNLDRVFTHDLPCPKEYASRAFTMYFKRLDEDRYEML